MENKRNRFLSYIYRKSKEGIHSIKFSDIEKEIGLSHNEIIDQITDLKDIMREHKLGFFQVIPQGDFIEVKIDFKKRDEIFATLLAL